MKIKTNCYKCKFRRELSWSAHSECIKPDPDMTGDERGIRKGWFYYPSYFDPVWMTKECDNFEEE